MTEYNYMSGSSIDNIANFIFDAFMSDSCYMGFARGGIPQSGYSDFQWGRNSLIYIEHSVPLSANVAMEGASISGDYFYDVNSKQILGAGDGVRTIRIGRRANSGGNTTFLSRDDIGDIKLVYLGEDWAIVEGLSQYYYEFMTLSPTASYYLHNYNDDATPIKILNKSIVNVPYYTTNCSLWYKETSGSQFSLALSGLQRTINFLGETYITGLTEPLDLPDSSMFKNIGVSAINNKQRLLSAYYFTLRDETGAILLDNMHFVDNDPYSATETYTEVQNIGGSQKYVTFNYPYIDGELQYIKIMIGPNQAEELAVWCENLPYESIIPISDSNPPALDVSYLKNLSIATSLFDTRGFTKIHYSPDLSATEVSFVKEINNTTERATYEGYGFNIETIVLHGTPTEHVGIIREEVNYGDTEILLYNFSGFVVDDVITIKYDVTNPAVSAGGENYLVIATDYTNGANKITLNKPVYITKPISANYILHSNPTTAHAVVTLAQTTDKNKALKYGFFNVLVNKTVPLTGAQSPTVGVYRQLFVCYKPRDEFGDLCIDDVYNGDTSLHGVNFNKSTWINDNGILMYIANKIPVYRRWANTDETFKIII